MIYLDLNKWIDLAHAATGTVKGQHHAVELKTATEFVREGAVVFPLSAVHFMEVAKIGNDAQRRTLARLMVMLSQGWFLSSPSSLLHHELRRAIATQLNVQAPTDPSVSCLTRKIEAVCPSESEIPYGPVAALLSQYPHMLEDFLATVRVQQPFLDNWRRYAREHEAGRLLRRDSTKEIRKRTYCASLILGIQDRLTAVLKEFGLSMLPYMEALGPNGCVSLLEGVPFFDVEMSLHLERNEHHDRLIQPNDEPDLAFLSIAIPYCHTVVTEKFWTNLARRLKLHQKYNTEICSNLSWALSLTTSVRSDPLQNP